MTIELVPLCDVDITLSDQVLVGEGPSGLRVVAEVGGIVVEGDRLRGGGRGTSGADWVTIVGGIATVDVRFTIETHDGAVVYVTYTGRSDFREGPGAHPIYAAPKFETGDERYAWLNLVQAVSKGTLDGDHVRYEIAEVR
ncbi:DUF3237 domain-containing protein [Iamia sp. SCSIO 61187]|uniref:DUF3237 family protein n=1 Tax=Iamia sp. SCSIO 61187 TaxID=2722752 RepID=UPI001C62FF8C|nr:DUF3237 family protein [Iamia sp. SCSIO 61187]QYG93781.1 DUF3237 domain-containing protein [Iamia sp. SCSIO 61187]